MRPDSSLVLHEHRDPSAGWSAAEKRCGLCGGATEDWFEKRGRHFVLCSACGHVSVREGLAFVEPGVSIYEAEQSVFQADGNEGYYFDHESNFSNCRSKLAWVARDVPAGARLLDVGSNFGHFLKVASERYQAQGLDVSPSAVNWSRQRFGVSAFVGSIYSVPESLNGFDAVTCWDVIEHLPDPIDALKRMSGLLRAGGRLFLSTPDAGSLAARLLGRRWHYLDPVQHINLFSRQNLMLALAASDLASERVAALGHRYRLRYVFDRLRYLHPRGLLGTCVSLGRTLARPFLDRSVYLQLGDVMILTAIRRD